MEEMNRIRKIAHGDVNALKEVYEIYKTPVYRIALSITKNHSAAEDITQDTFLRIQEKADRYHYFTSEAAWIYTIARNITYDTLRKNKHEICEEMIYADESFAEEGNPEKGEYAFFDLIKNLSEKDAEIVRFRILADLSFKEISQITNLSVKACNKRYNRALAKLRKEMEEV
jgi:RNA polymerase sigma-70 factor (ECF subfamily)